MDQGKISHLAFDLNSEPERAYHSSENQQTNSCLSVDLSLPVDLNSVPESPYPFSQNLQTNIDLNSVPESSCLFVDLNLVPESYCHSSQNQQMNSYFQAEVDNKNHSFHSKRKSLEDDVDGEDEIVAKRLKADREKLRRDKLNDCFHELGDILDSDRHKNNKRIILDEAINLLKDLTSEVSRLKTENVALSEESHELIQEKSELRSEKASLKSDIENLELQFQRSLNLIVPWAPTDPSEFVGQSYPFALHAPLGPIRINSPPLQSIPFFEEQSGMSSNSGSTFSPHLALVHPCIDKPSTSIASTSYNPSQQNSESKQSNNEGDQAVNYGNVATELELMPGSITKKLSAKDKGKQPIEDDESIRDRSFLSAPSFSGGFQGCYSGSMHGM